MHQGSVGMQLKVDGCGIRMSRLCKEVLKPKNFIRDNVKQLREVQKTCKQKQQSGANQPLKALWKSDKYKNVPSKVKLALEEPQAARPSTAQFLRAHSRVGQPVKCPPSRPHSACELPLAKPAVPPASDAVKVKLVHKNVDFIKMNNQAVRHNSLNRCPSLSALDDMKNKQDGDLKKYKKGEVPKYLKQRKIQWDQEERDKIANTPDPSLPPGHKILPENERLDTLQLLKKNECDLMQQLQALPLRTDTFRMRNQKQEIECKLSEVEEAIKIFSRPKVFVKMES